MAGVVGVGRCCLRLAERLTEACGPGSASRHSIGTGVFFGMLVAITVGIVLVPFFFVLIYKIKGKMRMERIAQKKEVVTSILKRHKNGKL